MMHDLLVFIVPKLAERGTVVLPLVALVFIVVACRKICIRLKMFIRQNANNFKSKIIEK
jgi:hypothetical protein